jgi:hypothetical protein
VFRFLVSPDLAVPLILGTDFFIKTALVLYVRDSCLHFLFAPNSHVSFLSVSCCNFCLQAVVEEQQPSGIGPDLSHLAGEHRRRLREVIARFPEVLTTRLGLTHLLEYNIRLTNTKPVRSPPFRLALPKMQFLREHLKCLLEDGVIEPSTSQYSSPVFLVPKPDQSYRAVVDYRRLNQCIEVESVPLPDIHSAFHWFPKA